jgi:hypothetical protein
VDREQVRTRIARTSLRIMVNHKADICDHNLPSRQTMTMRPLGEVPTTTLGGGLWIRFFLRAELTPSTHRWRKERSDYQPRQSCEEAADASPGGRLSLNESMSLSTEITHFRFGHAQGSPLLNQPVQTNFKKLLKPNQLPLKSCKLPFLG